jgi:hypothetical protein
MENKLEADILAELRLYSTDEGGLKNPIFLPKVGCILTFEGEHFSCFLLLEQNTEIAPGDEAVLYIKFLSPELIKPKLKIGDVFTLRDYRDFASGRVTEVLV